MFWHAGRYKPVGRDTTRQLIAFADRIDGKHADDAGSSGWAILH